jgi:hypothetical protein
VNAAVAERVAELEAERARPTPRRTKPDPNAAVPPHEQARHRADLLAAAYGTDTDHGAQT